MIFFSRLLEHNLDIVKLKKKRTKLQSAVRININCAKMVFYDYRDDRMAIHMDPMYWPPMKKKLTVYVKPGYMHYVTVYKWVNTIIFMKDEGFAYYFVDKIIIVRQNKTYTFTNIHVFQDVLFCYYHDIMCCLDPIVNGRKWGDWSCKSYMSSALEKNNFYEDLSVLLKNNVL